MHFSSDTFLLSYGNSSNKLVLRKLKSNASTLSMLPDSTLPIAAPEIPLTSSVHAFDRINTILILYAGGGASGSKVNLYYNVFDKNLSLNTNGMLKDNIGDSSSLPWTPEFGVTAYDTNRFAAVYWTSGGLWLDTIFFNGTSIEHAAVKLIDIGYFDSAATIVSNGNSIVALWKGHSISSGNPAVEGVKYYLKPDGSIDFSSGTFMVFSDNSISAFNTKNLTSTNRRSFNQISAAMDANGSVALAWSTSATNKSRGCIWGNTSVRYPFGYWTSPVCSTNALSSDSLVYLPGIKVQGGGVGNTYDSIRVGPSPTIGAGWTGWVNFSDAAALAAATKGKNKYFQFKTVLERPADSLKTPSLKSYRVYWNTKPVISSLDSVRVNNVKQSASSFGDTVNVYSRVDTLDLYFGVHDADTGDTAMVTVTWQGTSQERRLTGVPYAHTTVKLSPGMKSDTMYACAVAAEDTAGWNAQTRSVYVKTSNDAPTLTVSAVWDSASNGPPFETRTIAAACTLYMQETDSVVLYYDVDDDNDPGIKAYVYLNNAKIDSTPTTAQGTHTFKTNGLVGTTDQVLVQTADPDSTVTRRFAIRVNHFPDIVSTTFNGSPKNHLDAVDVVVGQQTDIVVHVDDQDTLIWDTITYRFTTQSFDTPQKNRAFSFVPVRQDSTMRVIVSDKFNKADTALFRFQYPWYAVDAQNNPGYAYALDTLAARLSVIVGSGIVDTIGIPIINTGNIPLSIDSVFFGAGNKPWIQVGLWQTSQYRYFDSLPRGTGITPISIAAGQRRDIFVRIDPAGFTGDGFAYDTIIIVTNDLAHRYDTIPVRIEHNDLPVIVSLSFDFQADKPYWLPKYHKMAQGGGYTFPPHARIAVAFSEPMDSASAVGAIRLYSIFDSTVIDFEVPIPTTLAWSVNHDTMFISPAYNVPSPRFNLQPPIGMFVPTDSIAIVITSAITDRAILTTGHPNTLDLNRDYIIDVDTDTTFAFRVDSIHFTLVQFSPQAGQGSVPENAQISLRFSSPIYPGTIDTSKYDNRSLVVTSRYNSFYEPGRQISFDTVIVEQNIATFIPAKRFFFGDSVRCRYSAATGTDMHGYTADISGDGIPANMFDAESRDDDTTWYFSIVDNRSRTVKPDSAATGVSPTTDISLTFSRYVGPAVVDTSRIGNQSLVVRSLFSGGEQIGFDSVWFDGSTAYFSLDRRLFYHDSVSCEFRGLATRDSAMYSVAVHNGMMMTSADDRWWYFIVRDLTLQSVSPPCSSTGNSMHTSMSMTFSGPIPLNMFDTTGNTDSNASFSFSTRYSAGHPMRIRRVAFSPDSTTITIYPFAKFFSNDSVYCQFHGFSNNYRYGSNMSFLPGPGVPTHSSYTWHFFTEKTGFYTYPNPYKPGSDARHRALGGIWFKNLHNLTGEARVKLRVFSMTTHPVFDSDKAGTPVIFDETSETGPQWFWNTCNNKGEPLGSGVYPFAIYDSKDKVLAKGKLLIVR